MRVSRRVLQRNVRWVVRASNVFGWFGAVRWQRAVLHIRSMRSRRRRMSVRASSGSMTPSMSRRSDQTAQPAPIGVERRLVLGRERDHPRERRGADDRDGDRQHESIHVRAADLEMVSSPAQSEQSPRRWVLELGGDDASVHAARFVQRGIFAHADARLIGRVRDGRGYPLRTSSGEHECHERDGSGLHPLGVARRARTNVKVT